MKFVPSPFLAPEDLGIDLEEDSPDITSEDVRKAVETSSQEDFVTQVKTIVLRAPTKTPLFKLRRRGGVLFCCVTLGGKKTLFRMEWLRK